MRLMGSRRFRVIAATLLVVLTALFASVETYRRHDFTDYFLQRKGRLAAADISFREQGDGWQRFDVTLRDDRGIEIDAILQVPAADADSGRTVITGRTGADAQPATTLLVLAGVRTNRHSIEFVEDVNPLVLLFIDYPYEGKRSRLSAGEFLTALPRIRRAILDTPAAVTLAVDFLMTRTEVDKSRIVLVGGSFGALIGPAATACEPRIAGAAFLFGAGDLKTLMAANIPAPRWAASAGAGLGSLLTSPVEPTKYIGHIAPRPVFVLSGTFDERIPESCSRALHNAAGEPKTIRWIEADHLQITSETLQSLVRSEFETWLRETGFL